MRAVAALVLVVFTIPCFASDPPKAEGGSPDPKAIVQKAQDALRKTDIVSYRMQYTSTGWATEFVPNLDGEVTVGKQSPQKVERFVARVKLTPPKQTEAQDFTVGADGNVYYLVHAANKTVYEDLDPAVLGPYGRNLRRAVLPEFGDPEPFAEALKSGELTYEGAEKLGDEECHKVRIKLAQPPESIWWFSAKDGLPRQQRRILMREDKEGTTQITLSNVAAKPKPDKDPFKCVVPEGFTRTDEFAP